MTDMVCPRCREAYTHPGGASRAVPQRDIVICGPCCSDEIVYAAAGRLVPRVAEWPVRRGLAQHD